MQPWLLLLLIIIIMSKAVLRKIFEKAELKNKYFSPDPVLVTKCLEAYFYQFSVRPKAELENSRIHLSIKLLSFPIKLLSLSIKLLSFSIRLHPFRIQLISCSIKLLGAESVHQILTTTRLLREAQRKNESVAGQITA